MGTHFFYNFHRIKKKPGGINAMDHIHNAILVDVEIVIIMCIMML